MHFVQNNVMQKMNSFYKFKVNCIILYNDRNIYSTNLL